MRPQTPFVAFILIVAVCRLGGAESLYITGWAQFGGVERVIVTELPANHTWIIRSDREIGGCRLQRLDPARNSAWVSRDNQLIELNLPSTSPSAGLMERFLHTGELPPDYTGPWPDGYEPAFIHRVRLGVSEGVDEQKPAWGQKASAQYIGALRAFARTLPESQRETVDRELGRYSAGSLQSSEPEPPTPSPATEAPAATQPSNAGSEPNPDAAFLRQILASPIPEVGSLIGSGTDSQLSRLRKLYRAVEDPTVGIRLRQQMDGYAAPPIASYIRNAQGDWFDPAQP